MWPGLPQNMVPGFQGQSPQESDRSSTAISNLISLVTQHQVHHILFVRNKSLKAGPHLREVNQTLPFDGRCQHLGERF